MLIETRSVPPFQKNGYVVACETTRQAVMIDPGDEVQMLLDVVAQQSLQVQSMLLTHAHVDHVSGVARAKDVLSVPVYLHRDDQFLYDAAQEQAAFFGLHCGELPPIDRYYDPKGLLSFGEYRGQRASHAGTLSGWRLPGDRNAWLAQAGSVCRRYVVCRIDWPDGSTRRRLPNLDSFDYAGALSIRR